MKRIKKRLIRFPTEQVPIFHHMLSKPENGRKPSVLWCYKKELGFST